MSIARSINETLTDDTLLFILNKLETQEQKDNFSLVCKRWFQLQSSDRRRLRARAGHDMLRRMALRFSNILELDLSQCSSRSFYPGVSDSDLAVVATGFGSLRTLNLHSCKGITDTGLVAIGKSLAFLQSLDVSDCRKITNKGLISIASNCHSLQKLDLLGCRLITDDLLQSLSKNCSHLEELGLSGCTNITNLGLSNLAEGCRHIKSLDISKCTKISDDGVLKFADSCSTSIITLKLLECYKITDISLFSISNSCHKLVSLIIGGCRNITDESVKSLSLSLNSNLRTLRLAWCLNLTDSSMQRVIENCKDLVALDISGCEKVTDSAFLGLSQGRFESKLEILKMNNLPRITTLGIRVILSNCKKLKYIDIRSLPHVTELVFEEDGLRYPPLLRINFAGTPKRLRTSAGKAEGFRCSRSVQNKKS